MGTFYENLLFLVKSKCKLMNFMKNDYYAPMVELGDTQYLGYCVNWRVGSSPTWGTFKFEIFGSVVEMAIHAGLKILSSLRGCGFDSHLGYIKLENV